MDKTDQKKFNILAVDCCEHIVTAIKKIVGVKLIPITSRNNVNGSLKNYQLDLVVIGVTRFLVRRFYLNRLRKLFPQIPMLFLRREKAVSPNDCEMIRGDFIIGDQTPPNVLNMISLMRNIFPLEDCRDSHDTESHGLVGETMHIMAENFSDPHLNLRNVSEKLPVSPTKLSRVLNQQVGISFRQLLKQVRIEEAKLMIATHKYNIKEVAARTGFSDSHYFSKTFKEVTGVNPTSYEFSAEDLIFN